MPHFLKISRFWMIQDNISLQHVQQNNQTFDFTYNFKDSVYENNIHNWQNCDGDIENRIYREEFNGKKCKTDILLYCFHTAGVLHIFMLYNLLGPGISFYRKAKIIWPIIISYRLYAFHFTNEDFRYNYISNDVFIYIIHYKVYLTVSKIRNWNQ